MIIELCIHSKYFLLYDSLLNSTSHIVSYYIITYNIRIYLLVHH